MKTRLIINEDIWNAISQILREAKYVRAAIAYFGHEGSKLLDLHKSDVLVVDLSPSTVKTGATNPFEIEKLLRRGVKVFTHSNLHAKIILSDKAVIVGSTNISKNSRDILDEAAIITNEPIVMSRANDFIKRLCIEPIFPKYLQYCKKIYKSPRYHKGTTSKNGKSHRITHAKLRTVSLIDYYSFPKSEEKAYEKSENKAKKMISDERISKLDTFHWSRKPKMVSELTIGDFIIQCIQHKDKSITVSPPGRLILIDHYVRKQKGKERYLFHLEVPIHGERMDWRVFRRAINRLLKKEYKKPRSISVRDSIKADDLLKLWTPSGRISRK